MISKAILPSNQGALDFKEALDSWSIPARLIKNESRCVLFYATRLHGLQLVNLVNEHEPVFVRVDIFDVLFIEETYCNVNDKSLTLTKEVRNGDNT